MRNLVEFICTISTLRAGPQDILESFDVVSLFIKVPNCMGPVPPELTLMRIP
jgi:hypothetical protein